MGLPRFLVLPSYFKRPQLHEAFTCTSSYLKPQAWQMSSAIDSLFFTRLQSRPSRTRPW